MKTLKNAQVKLSEDGKSVTIVCDVVWQEVNHLLTTRVSHGHLNADNMKHPRMIQSSNTAVFLKSRNGNFSIPNDVIAAIAAVVEPKSTFSPVIKTGSTPENLMVISELPVTYQWQISDNPKPEGKYPPPVALWKDIAGATLKSVDENSIADGKWIRCVISNAAGSIITHPAQKVSDKK